MINEMERDGFFVIEVGLDPEDDRVCDYCNKLLARAVDEAGKLVLRAVENCHSTDHGLVCDDCLGDLVALRSWVAGQVYDNPY